MIFGISDDKIMTWYYYLNYRIYSYYRKRDNMPVFFSFLATTTLVTLNIFSILCVVGFFYPLTNVINKINMLVLYAVMAIFNYGVLYRNKYYEEVFYDFDKQGEKYKRWNLSVRLYIGISIAFLLATLAIIDLRNHGRI